MYRLYNKELLSSYGLCRATFDSTCTLWYFLYIYVWTCCFWNKRSPRILRSSPLPRFLANGDNPHRLSWIMALAWFVQPALKTVNNDWAATFTRRTSNKLGRGRVPSPLALHMPWVNITISMIQIQSNVLSSCSGGHTLWSIPSVINCENV